jgi:hypothetical protein
MALQGGLKSAEAHGVLRDAYGTSKILAYLSRSAEIVSPKGREEKIAQKLSDAAPLLNFS